MAVTSRNFLRELIAPEDAEIDLVAVHGLNPTNAEFHAEATWTAKNKKLWLTDFLPTQLPKARIMLFGYNSNVAFETSTAGVREQAENLLNRLKMMRDGASDRPIIFVCHSLGGIVVKRALVTAKLDETYDSIRSATYAICFFGTPHQGGSQAKLGIVAATIARAILRNPRNTFMEALKKDSLFADDLVQDFRHQLEDYHILSFFETRPFRSYGIIVDQKSATLGLTGTRERQISMDADHANICKFEDIEGDDYQQVIGNIAEFATRAIKAFKEKLRLESLRMPMQSPLESTGPTFLIPYTSSPRFVGRGDILKRLEKIFTGIERRREDRYQARAALYGLGGAGKSHIAIEFAYWLRKEHPGFSVFWIHGSNVERFEAAFRQIAEECNVPGADDPKSDKLNLVKQWLEQPHCRKWFMIIDNADDVEMFFSSSKSSEHGIFKSGHQHTQLSGLAKYLPECTHGSILMTTTNRVVGNKFIRDHGESLIEVKAMNDTESCELLCAPLDEGVIQTAERRELSKLLGNLPLALVQAAAFIREQEIDVKTYLQLYKADDDVKIELLSEPFESIGRDSATPNAVTATWMISYDQIRKINPQAADLLSLMAFLDRQAIPESLILQQIEGPLERIRALSILKAFSLITESKEHRRFEMHSLVHTVVRKWLMINKEFDKWAAKALMTVSMEYPSADFASWEQCALYLPHVRAVLRFRTEQMTEDPDVLSLLSRVALYHWHQGQWKEAEELLLQVVETNQRVRGLKDQATLISMGNLASIYWSAGRGEEAEKLESQVIEIGKRFFGEEHRETLILMSNLASTFGRQERWKEAENLETHVMQTSKRVLGHEHLDTLISTSNLASIYLGQGLWKEAEELETYLMHTKERLLGPEHPDTLATMHNLAWAWEYQDYSKKAMELMRTCVHRRTEILGASHPDTKMSAGALGAWSYVPDA